MAALVLAVITWFCVNGELTRQKKMRDKSYKPPTIEPAEQQMNKGFITEKK